MTRAAPTAPSAAGPPLTSEEVERIRADFPIFRSTVHGRPLVYLDSAATAQKPEVVIRTMERFYRSVNANIHRGVHHLSEVATREYERAREVVRRFLNASAIEEVVFVRGTTEAINLVATSYGGRHLNAGDEVLITALEHHSNIVPWQMLCEQRGATLRVVPMNDDGELVLEEYERMVGPRTRIVAVAHVSNALGTVNPVERMVEIARARGVPVLVDGAQAVPHQAVDVRALDCDFYSFSGHKLFGPTGVGVLFGKREILESMPPYQGGGDMIASVSFEKTIYNKLPYKFEAGTPNIAGVVGLAAAIEYVEAVGMARISAYEHGLLRYATDALRGVSGLRLFGTASRKTGVLSFTLDCAHPHDVGTILDQEGIAIRTGHHCAQPVMDRFGVPATARASLAMYNTRADIDALEQGLGKVLEVFRG